MQSIKFTAPLVLSIPVLLLFALSPGNGELTAGSSGEKAFIERCGNCHSIAPPPASAPPAWGIAMHYRLRYPVRSDFNRAIINFVQKPDNSKILMTDAIERFGSMSPMPLADDLLKPIADFLWDLSEQRRSGNGPGAGGGKGKKAGP